MDLLTVALAGVAACTTLSGDAGAYCRALEQQNTGLCYSIQDADKRAACRAEVAGNPAFCDGIADPTARQECKMRAGR